MSETEAESRDVDPKADSGPQQPLVSLPYANLSQAVSNLEWAWQRGAFNGQPLQAQFSVLSNLMLLQRDLAPRG